MAAAAAAAYTTAASNTAAGFRGWLGAGVATRATRRGNAQGAAHVRAKAGGSRVTMAQLQEHFVQHRKSTLAEAVKDIRLGGQGSDSAMQSSASIYS